MTQLNPEPQGAQRAQRFAVKFKREDGLRYWFMTPDGGCNHLRIHAASFSSREEAQNFIDTNSAGNSGILFRIQPLQPVKRRKPRR